MLDYLHRHRLESRIVAGRFKRKAAAQHMRKVVAKVHAHAKARAERMARNAKLKGIRNRVLAHSAEAKPNAAR
jgi:hypothetical protein